MAALPLPGTGAKPLSVPPETSMSASVKLLAFSLKVKVISSVLPLARLLVLARATTMVGAAVSAGGLGLAWVL